MSKGSRRRPASVPRATLDDAWARTFGREHVQITVDGPMVCAESDSDPGTFWDGQGVVQSKAA